MTLGGTHDLMNSKLDKSLPPVGVCRKGTGLNKELDRGNDVANPRIMLFVYLQIARVSIHARLCSPSGHVLLYGLILLIGSATLPSLRWIVGFCSSNTMTILEESYCPIGQ